MSVTATETKLVAVTNPVAIKDNASWVTTEIDTRGWEHCTIYAMLGVSDIAMAALKVQESDTSGSGMADVVGAVYGAGGSSLPSATDDGLIFGIDLDLKARKRFLDLVMTAGDGALGTYATAWAVLSRGHQVPMTPSERGLSQLLRV